jgi:hypothetical protein
MGLWVEVLFQRVGIRNQIRRQLLHGWAACLGGELRKLILETLGGFVPCLVKLAPGESIKLCQDLAFDGFAKLVKGMEESFTARLILGAGRYNLEVYSVVVESQHKRQGRAIAHIENSSQPRRYISGTCHGRGRLSRGKGGCEIETKPGIRGRGGGWSKQ